MNETLEHLRTLSRSEIRDFADQAKAEGDTHKAFLAGYALGEAYAKERYDTDS